MKKDITCVVCSGNSFKEHDHPQGGAVYYECNNCEAETDGYNGWSNLASAEEKHINSIRPSVIEVSAKTKNGYSEVVATFQSGSAYIAAFESLFKWAEERGFYSIIISIK
jgi:hypothetical protein